MKSLENMIRVFLVLLVVLTGSIACVGQDESAILRQAFESHQAGNYAAAIDGYQRFLKVHPEAAPVRSNLGAALAHEGRYEEAIREYSLALSVDPHDVRVRLNLALAYYKAGNLGQATVNLEKIH